MPFRSNSAAIVMSFDDGADTIKIRDYNWHFEISRITGGATGAEWSVNSNIGKKLVAWESYTLLVSDYKKSGTARRPALALAPYKSQYATKRSGFAFRSVAEAIVSVATIVTDALY